MTAPEMHLRTLEQLDAVLGCDAGAVLVLFGAAACARFRTTRRDLAAVATELSDAPIRICIVETDTHPELSRPFRIEGGATVLSFVDGKIIDAAVGRLCRERLHKQARWLIEQAGGDGLFSRLFAGLRRLAS